MKIRQQTNQPTNQEPATQSFNCRGLGVLATVKHWRRHDLSSVIRPRNRGHLHLNLRQRCLRLAVTPRRAVTSSWFFFLGGGVDVELKTKSVLGFLVEVLFVLVFFLFDVDGESRSLSRLFWLVLKNSWMKPIELKFKKQKWPKLKKKLSNETCSVCPKLVEGFATDEGAETPRACRTSANKVGSRPKRDPKIPFKTDVSLMWFVMFVPTYRWNLAGDDSWGGMKIDRKDLQAIVAWSHVWT